MLRIINSKLSVTGFLLIAFFLALIIRLGVIFTIGNIGYPEMYEHGELARNLLKGNGYSLHWHYGPMSPEKLEIFEEAPKYEGAFLPPLSPYLIYFFFSVFGDNPTSYMLMMLMHALIGALTVLIVYRIAERIGSETEARISAIVSAVFLPAVFAVTTYSGSVIFQALSLLVILFAIRAVQEPFYKNFILLGITIGAQILLRAEFLALGIVILILTAFLTWRRFYKYEKKSLLCHSVSSEESNTLIDKKNRFFAALRMTGNKLRMTGNKLRMTG
ncbi:MAG: 2 protein, partial [Bacteroidota bacterium]|nr:2 protein [Bacteroidota bacterium]